MRVTVYLPESIREEAERIAHEQGVSVSTLCTRAVEQYLDERRRNRAVRRIGELIGSTYVAPDALEQLQRERRASEKDIG